MCDAGWVRLRDSDCFFCLSKPTRRTIFFPVLLDWSANKLCYRLIGFSFVAGLSSLALVVPSSWCCLGRLASLASRIAVDGGWLKVGFGFAAAFDVMLNFANNFRSEAETW